MAQPVRWSGSWSLRDYGAPLPSVPPPAPPFEKWVPPPESFAFGELPRDLARYQPEVKTLPFTQVLPIPPNPVGSSMPEVQRWLPWALRDYSANQDYFSILATPLLPPPVSSSLPQMQPWAPWTLRDYSAYPIQSSAWLAVVTPSPFVPSSEIIAFGELPRDMTALALVNSFLQRILPPQTPPLLIQVVPGAKMLAFGELPPDRSAERFVLMWQNHIGIAFSGIPQVPIGGVFVGFDYEPIDMTPYKAVFPQLTPPAVQPQIPPSSVPFIEWPPWQWGQYQAMQDQFSALATPAPGVYPAGLLPQFTLEALIRFPWPYQLPLNFIVPPPPPFVFPTPLTYLEPPDWNWLNYRSFQMGFAGWVTQIPPPPPFRVQAVTSGWYNGYYYQPGDVFDLLSALDFSDASVDYSRGLAGTLQFGWMRKVPLNTPLFATETSQPTPLFPVIDPVPPKRFVY